MTTKRRPRQTIKIEEYTLDEPDPECGNILYADVCAPDGTECFTLAVGPETYQDGWDRKWTGNAEVYFREADGEDFDVIKTVRGLKKGKDNTRFASQLIKKNIAKAIKIQKEITADAR